jgi:hypothetical protein
LKPDPVIPSEDVETHCVEVPVFMSTSPQVAVVLKASRSAPDTARFVVVAEVKVAVDDLIPLLNRALPVTSKIFPVVVVADAPRINTFDEVVG